MKPPRISEWLLLRLHPSEEREAVAGDLAEEFTAISAARGSRAARRWYRRQLRGSITPNLIRRLRHRPPPGQHTHQPGGLAMQSVLHDVRFTLRLAARRPLVTSIALASLAVSVALATTIFALLNAVLIRPLPVEDPDGLALVVERRQTGTAFNFSYPDFLDYRDRQQAFSHLIGWSSAEATLRAGTGAEPLAGEMVTDGFFPTLGVSMRMGRAFSPADHTPGAKPVAVVSDALWRRLGGGGAFEPRTLTLNGATIDIVGVVHRPFSGMEIGRQAMFWVPMSHLPIMEPGDDSLGDRRSSWLLMMGRLRDGVSLQQAEQDLARVESSFAGEPSHRQMVLAVEPGGRGASMFPKQAETTLQLLLAASLLVLVIAAANVANLLLSRAADRNREFAIRAALGAGRARLGRLVLVETTLLGLCAGTLAAIVAQWVVGFTLPFIRVFGEPIWLDVSLDHRGLMFAAAAGFFAASIAGLPATWQVLRRPVGDIQLADGGRTASAGPASGRFRWGLLVAQFAISLALVAAAALFVRTVANLQSTSTGYDADHIALLSADPTKAMTEAAAIREYIDTAESRLASIPGVRAVSFARVTPMNFGGSRMSVDVPGYDAQPDEDMELNYNVVTTDYFPATGIALLAGRAFTDADRVGRPLVAIVNDNMADRFWNGNAVGRTFRLGETAVEVVGIAPDVKYRMVREQPRASFYLSMAQAAPRYGVFHVRTEGDPSALLQTLRQTLAEVDPRIAVSDVRTLRQQIRANINDDRLAMTIGAVLGGTALLLAAAGLFASMWYAVGRRTREIGVRIALGAGESGVRRMVLGEALAVVIAGCACGAALAFWLGQLVESRLYEVSAADPFSFGAATVVLGLAALLAAWLPARRAAHIDPVVALREE